MNSPTSSRRFTTASCPTSRLIPVRTAVLNSRFSAFTSCCPRGSARNRNRPVSSVVTTRVAPVSRLFTVTVAPATARPDASSVLPVIAAPVCAHAAAELVSSRRSGQHIRRENSRALPAGLAKLARRGREYNLIAGFVNRRLRCIGSLGIHQSQVLENSIYVAVLRLPEEITVGPK